LRRNDATIIGMTTKTPMMTATATITMLGIWVIVGGESSD
jgi:hypothetical protein